MELKSLLAKSLIVEEVNEQTSSENCTNWDSLGQLSIIANLSKATHGATDEIREISIVTTYKQLRDLLVKHGILKDV